MHLEAYGGFREALAAALAEHPLPKYPVCLDLGGANNNGSVHDLLPHKTRIEVLDIADGDDVNIVADATTWTPTARYDLVIATEVFEHVKNWPAIVSTAFKALNRDGVFVTTCASTGRRPHGAWGGMDPEPGEWYKNVGISDMHEVLIDVGFSPTEVTFNANPGDLYAWGVKP